MTAPLAEYLGEAVQDYQRAVKEAVLDRQLCDEAEALKLATFSVGPIKAQAPVPPQSCLDPTEGLLGSLVERGPGGVLAGVVELDRSEFGQVWAAVHTHLVSVMTWIAQSWGRCGLQCKRKYISPQSSVEGLALLREWLHPKWGNPRGWQGMFGCGRQSGPSEMVATGSRLRVTPPVLLDAHQRTTH